ncbi:acyltransferase family protein [Desulfogranum japonicum]|uniref:acyltransferase family protein n=1 Tax=Desulfogranum japonicum TaxID=231447 RepID=UPI0003F50BE3|nr:acyltransferase [Desulfogranum japonicum]
MYLHSFGHFRAIAILLIVAGHCYGLVGWKIDSVPDRILASLLTGATGMFVFISGFFFHFVFYSRFEYRDFMRKKSLAVLLPYCILSMIALLYTVYFLQHPPYKDQLYTGQTDLWHAHVWPIMQYYWYGALSYPYWYIPFIMLTFALSPLHIRYVHLPVNRQLGILLMLAMVAMFMHRPLYNLSNFQSVLYFSPFYLMGILCSQNADTIQRRLSGKEWLFFSIAVLFAVLEVVLQHRFGNYHKLPLQWKGIDFMVGQKMALVMGCYLFLRRFDQVPNRILNQVASMSFAIFFLHPFVLHLFGTWMRMYHIRLHAGVLLPLAVIMVTAVTMGIAWIIKQVLGKRSVYVIGW